MAGDDGRWLGRVMLALCVGLGMVLLGSLLGHQPARSGAGTGLVLVGVGVLLAGAVAALSGDRTRGRRRRGSLTARLRTMARDRDPTHKPPDPSQRGSVSTRRHKE